MNAFELGLWIVFAGCVSLWGISTWVWETQKKRLLKHERFTGFCKGYAQGWEDALTHREEE